MHQQGKKENSNTTEIDLLSVFIHFGKNIKYFFQSTLKSIGQLGLHLARIIIQNFWLIAIIVVIFLSYGYYSYKKELSNLEGEALVQCNGFCNSTLELEIKKLNSSIRNKNNANLTSLLNIPDSSIQKISSICMGYGIDLDNDSIPNLVSYNENGAPNITEVEQKKDNENKTIWAKKTTRGRIPRIAYISIVVNTLNVDEFNAISNGVLYYINNCPYLMKANSSYRLMCQDQVSALNKQLILLDSLQKIEYIEVARKKGERAPSDRVIFTSSYQGKEKQQLHEDVLKISTNKLKLEKTLRDEEYAISIISDFKPIISEKQTLNKFLISNLLLGLILGYIFGLLKTSYPRIKKFIQDSK